MSQRTEGQKTDGRQMASERAADGQTADEQMASERAADEQAARFLRQITTIAVVGLSDNPGRNSYEVAAYLQSQGYEIVPVNPNARMVLGRTARPSLRDVEGKIDLVDVFRKSEAVAEIIDDAIAVGAGGVWLQLGISDEEAEKRARDAGLFVVSNRCLMMEHRRLSARRRFIQG